jgi:hypothetical protein
VFGQNHLYVRMLHTGIPLFRVMSEEFQSSLSAVRTMCHPVLMPICPDNVSSCSDARQSSIFRLDDVLLLSGHFTLSRSFCASLLRPDVSAACPDAYQFSNGSLKPCQVPRKERSINRPDDVVYRSDAYLRKARIAVQNEPSGHLTAMVRTLVHRIW